MVIMLRRTICCFTFFSLAIAGTVVPAQDEPPNPSSVELAAYLRSKTPSTGSECLAYLMFDPPEISIRESCKERIIEIQYDEQLESSMLLRKESVSGALLNEDNGTINVQLSQLYTKLMMVDTELGTMALLSQWDLNLPGFHMLTFTLLKSKL